MATMLNRLTNFFRTDYDAAKTSNKRKPGNPHLKHEDEQLYGTDRKRLTGTGRSLARNFSIVAWAIRKHLDYVTQFEFQLRTENDTLNKQVEQLMREWYRPNNCDVAGRHSFPKIIRMTEARRTVDGDMFLMKRSNGRLGAVEGDLISTPSKTETGERWYNGVRVNNDGRALQYGLHQRTNNGGYDWVRNVRAANMFQHANYERFDQVRGISPLSAAYNSFQDVYEGIDYALAKMKVEQLFAMVIYSNSPSGTGDHTRTGDGSYSVDMGQGPVKLEMDNDDRAEFLKTDNPGSNTQEFLHTVLGIALKALDLPFNFYDESHTNFFGSRAAWLLYDRSCNSKRQDVQELLRKITVWRLQLWIMDGTIQLPAGATIRDLNFEWVPRGMPWWDPSKEIDGDIKAISAGLDNPYRVCKERGRGEFEDNVDQIARAQEYAASKGVTLSYAMEVPQEPAEPEPEQPEVSEDEEE